MFWKKSLHGFQIHFESEWTCLLIPLCPQAFRSMNDRSPFWPFFKTVLSFTTLLMRWKPGPGKPFVSLCLPWEPRGRPLHWPSWCVSCLSFLPCDTWCLEADSHLLTVSLWRWNSGSSQASFPPTLAVLLRPLEVAGPTASGKAPEEGHLLLLFHLQVTFRHCVFIFMLTSSSKFILCSSSWKDSPTSGHSPLLNERLTYL